MPRRSADAEDKRRIITATDEGMSAGARQRDRRCGQTVGCRCLLPLRPRLFLCRRIGGAGRGPCARRRIFHFFPRIFLSFRFSRERVIVFLINTQCVLIILYRHMMPVTRVDQCEVNNWLLAYRVNAIIPKLVK
jgi:hypothetical protein